MLIDITAPKRCVFLGGDFVLLIFVITYYNYIIPRVYLIVKGNKIISYYLLIKPKKGERNLANIDKTVQVILELLNREQREQRELADALGLHPQTITDWKNGKSKSYNSHLPKIAEFFGVSIDYLLGADTIKVVDEERNIIVLDDDTLEIIRSLRERPEMKMVFSTMKKATKEDIIQAVKIIEALKDND